MAIYGRAIMPNYNRDMGAAPLDKLVLLLVPSGDPTYPIAIEIGNWDDKERRFLGNWRWYDDEAGITRTPTRSRGGRYPRSMPTSPPSSPRERPDSRLQAACPCNFPKCQRRLEQTASQ